ncbi:MAG: transglutaminase-like domain-containing protein [Phycisphaerales bacterium]|nr:transglutaminase-like domain-containing protein [Phycisphaerales bacterium]
MSMKIKSPMCLKPTASIWDYLALPDQELERMDVVALNLAVLRGLEQYKDLDVERYIKTVDEWTNEFARRLPASEAFFWETGPALWKNDIRFYRMGMLQVFLGQVIGIRYIEEKRHVHCVQYTNAGDLFLNGVIDTKRGTCGNLATIHVAMARRMGWPVSLACIRHHFLSRFDDGEVVYNIECTDNEREGFAEGSDADYMKRVHLPKKAVECGSDLRKLTAREMIAVFINHRARHHQDCMRYDLCDADCSLARALCPNQRSLYEMSMMPFLHKGEKLFDPEELGHPRERCRHIYAQDYLNPHLGAMKITYVAAPKAAPKKEPVIHTIKTAPSLKTAPNLGAMKFTYVSAPQKKPPKKEPVIRTIKATRIIMNGVKNV